MLTFSGFVFSIIFTLIQWQQQTTGVMASFRGLSAVSDKIAWASGTGGSVIRTTDGGQSWQNVSVPNAEKLDFRDIDAFDAQTAYILSIGNGDSSRIYKTTNGGKSWRQQFQNTNPKAFFDAMAFWDENHGIAMSDPVNGKFLIITTDDGGANWKPAPSENMPPALANEGGFAASGTCITVQGKNNVWFGTGGASVARVFHSSDRGKTWSVAETPILAGIPSAGVFSVAFKDANNGVIVGGDYQKPNEATNNLAVTSDGGKTWKLFEKSKPTGFRSGLAFVSTKNGMAMIAVGTSGSDYSVNSGDWVNLDHENYNVVSVSKNGAVWAAGPKGRIAKLIIP